MLDMTIAEMLLIVLIANILRRLIVDRLDRQRIENYIAAQRNQVLRIR